MKQQKFELNNLGSSQKIIEMLRGKQAGIQLEKFSAGWNQKHVKPY